MSYVMNLFFGTLWFFMIFVVLSPEVVGEWQAQRDITYSSIMNEYVSDWDMDFESDRN